jgi:hypothetical protein
VDTEKLWESPQPASSDSRAPQYRAPQLCGGWGGKGNGAISKVFSISEQYVPIPPENSEATGGL